MVPPIAPPAMAPTFVCEAVGTDDGDGDEDEDEDAVITEVRTIPELVIVTYSKSEEVKKFPEQISWAYTDSRTCRESRT